MPAKPTQRDKVLAFLRDAGGRGIHTHELRQAMIGNPSQRIAELEGLGHRIEHKRERRNDSPGTRYFLRSAGGEGAVSSPAPVRDDDRTLPVTGPPALTDQAAVRGGGADGFPKPGSSTARERKAGADIAPAADIGSLFGDEPVEQSSTSAYDPFSEAA